jgi:hypothetical protein
MDVSHRLRAFDAAIGRRRDRDAPRAVDRIPCIGAASEQRRLDARRSAGGCSSSPLFFIPAGRQPEKRSTPAKIRLPKNSAKIASSIVRLRRLRSGVAVEGSGLFIAGLAEGQDERRRQHGDGQCEPLHGVAAVAFRRQGVGEQLQVAR